VLHVGCGGQDLDPTWKVVPALIADIDGETAPDAVLAVEKDPVHDLDHKEAPFRRCHIHPTDDPLGETLTWIGWMEVDADLIPHRDLHLSHPPMLHLTALGAETPT
jgi:hypothetical protein